MTYSVRDLADQIAADRQQTEGLQPGIRARKDETEAIIAMAREMGLEGGSYLEQLLKTVDELDEAEALRLEVEGILEKARFMAMSAITGTYGTGSGNYAVPVSPGAVNNSKTGDRPPSGRELIKAQPKRSRLSRLARAAMKDEATDPGKTLAESAASIADAFKREFGPPITETRTETQVPSGPVIQVPPKPTVGPGDAAMAAIALAVVVARGKETVSNAASRWSGKTREQRNDG